MNKLLINYFVYFLCIFIVFAEEGYSQQSQPVLLKQSNSKSKLTDLQKAFNNRWDDYNVKNGYYYEDGEEKKAPNWKVFKRWEWYWDQRINLETGEFPTTNAAAEYEKVRHSLKKTTSLNESWTNLGTNSSTGGYAGIGRINCVAFHPSDANTFWVGSPSGGIWRTTDGGSNWTILNDGETVLGVSDIAINSDYSTSQTLYIATGDRDGGSMWSLSGGQGADNVTVGVYKSTDGGSTWSATGLTFSKSTGAKIYSLLIDPTNDNTLYASVNTGSTGTRGIYKSTDGGANWTRKTGNIWADMEFKPGTPATIYASSIGFGSVYTNISTDSGENWSIAEIASGGYRGELAVSAANSSIVYLIVANISGGLTDVYKSTNSGTSFSALSASSKSMLGYYSDGSGSNTGQGTYDLCIAASPSDANTVYIGGINTWKSTDGGSTWTINNMWTSSGTYNKSSAPVAHADKHALAFNGSTLFEGNDGGVYKTTDGGSTWTDLTNGMVISQLYRIGVSQTSENTILTGLQDNGTKKYSGSWTDVYGGDGMECIIDHTSASSYMYVTYVNGEIQRNSNGFSTLSTTQISANIPGGQPTGAWVTPYIMDPTNSSILFAGYDQVWKTTDRGDNWTSVSQVLSSTTKLRSLAIAPSNTNVIYAADQTNMWKTTDGGATNWSTITLPSTSTSVTYIAVHPTSPDTLWITYGGYVDGQKVYESVDGGANWTSTSTGLPNLPVMSIVHYKSVTDKNVLFVGTDLGVYVKDGSSNWAEYNTNLPNVVVTELEIYYNSGGTDKLRAGTYGRGLWETEILSPLPVELTTFTASSSSGSSVSLNWETATEINNHGFHVERQSAPSVSEIKEENWETLEFINGHGNSNSPKYYSYTDNNPSGGSNFIYRLKQVDIDGQFDYSDMVEVTVSPDQFVLNQNYPNPFNPTTTISYRVPVRSIVTIDVYDVLGREIVSLVNEYKESGIYEAEFDASNLPTGIYYYTLKAGDFSQTSKMLLVK